MSVSNDILGFKYQIYEGDDLKIYRTIRFKDYDKDYILIGKTSNNLITINDTLIKIDDIYDIKEK